MFGEEKRIVPCYDHRVMIHFNSAINIIRRAEIIHMFDSGVFLKKVNKGALNEVAYFLWGRWAAKFKKLFLVLSGNFLEKPEHLECNLV